MPKRPQEPSYPLHYTSQAVLLDNAAAGVQLAGTLTHPTRALPVPAVLLIPGSGPQDRDEQVCGHRPFLVLADHLTRAGMAVLRLDDRGVGNSSGDKNQSTHKDLLQDIHLALNHLAGHPCVDARRIGLLGHSEGTVLAAAAAVADARAAFAVLLAPPALPGEQTLHAQSALIAEMSGATPAQIAHERRMNEAVFAALRQPLAPEAVRAQVLATLSAHLRTWPGRPVSECELASAASTMADAVLAPAFRAFLQADPARCFAQLHCPVLALFGERDVQAPPYLHLPALREALCAAGNTDATIEQWPGLNHLLQTAATGSIDAYETIEETMAPAVLHRISDWIRSRTGIPCATDPPPPS